VDKISPYKNFSISGSVIPLLETAKKFKKQLKQIEEKISFSLKENLKRFDEFLDNFEYYLKQRKELLKNCSSNWVKIKKQD